MKNLQAEFDTLALSMPATTKAKGPKVSQVQHDDSKGKGKCKQGEVSSAAREGQPNPKTSSYRDQFETCKFYSTQNGCNRGRKCKDWHEFAEAKKDGRCVNCGSKKHAEADCTRPKAKGKGKGEDGENAQVPKGKGKEQSSLGESGQNQPSSKSEPNPKAAAAAVASPPQPSEQPASPATASQQSVQQGEGVPAKAASMFVSDMSCIARQFEDQCVACGCSFKFVGQSWQSCA